MKKLILITVTTAALAAGTAAPTPAAAAEPRDLIGALLGLAVLGAIVNEVGNDRDKSSDAQATRRSQTPDWRKRQRNTGDRYYGHRHNSRPARILPGECLRVVENRKNDRFVLPETCLNRAGIRSRELPGRCESRLPTRRGRIDVYGARCLADAGWRLPRIAARR